MTASKANIGVAPSKAKVSHLGALGGAKVEAADNMKAPEEKFHDLNFKVPAEFHLRFKMTATAAGITMKELLMESFETWVEKQKGR